MKWESQYKVPIHIDQQRRADVPDYDDFVYQNMIREFVTAKLHNQKRVHLEIEFTKYDEAYLEVLSEKINKATSPMEIDLYTSQHAQIRRQLNMDRITLYQLIINYEIL